MKWKPETYYIKALDKEIVKIYFRRKQNEFRRDHFSQIYAERHKFVKTN